MAIEVAKYQFQSWARKGISANILQADTLGNPAMPLPAGERATVPIGVSINETPQPPKQFELVGPGDIVGIMRDMVVRVEPRHWITDFEPNYLAFIEFYDEDFPWRYTPAAPQNDRLRPWLFLLVLKEDEFERDNNRLPLPVLKLKTANALPPHTETWLWAHVHTEQDIPMNELSDLEEYLNNLRETTRTDPDQIYSRLMSPRHLEANQAYHAFLVPAFEVGRLAGLGLPTTGISAQQPAWNDASSSVDLPIYYDWYFRTGVDADFESLVTLLEPRVLDPRIGIRRMDCSRPGFVKADAQGREIPPLPGEAPGLTAPDPLVQGLEGALKTPDTRSIPEVFTPNTFQTELQLLVNLPETVETDFNALPGSEEDFLNDPIITAPFYGQNHARQHRSDKILLDVSKNGWYHDLNRDPRNRVPAGFGTLVVQKNQESYVQKAWQQVQKVYEANRKAWQFRFMLQVSLFFRDQIFATINTASFMALTAPIHAKVLGSPTTIRKQLSESRLASPVFSAAFRRLVRPSGKLARRIQADRTDRFDFAGLVNDVNTGIVSPAPPRKIPQGLPSLDTLAERVSPADIPAWLRWLLRNSLLALFIVLFLLLALGLFTGAWVSVGILAVAAAGAYRWLKSRQESADTAAALVDPVKGQEALARVSVRPAFNIVREGETAAPPPTPGPSPQSDSVEARNFRTAATRMQLRNTIRPPEKAAALAFDMQNGYSKVLKAIDPKLAYYKRFTAVVNIPGRVVAETPEPIVDAMAHPDFEDAMYAPLRDIDKELLIPNLQLIPPNTISLLETNPKFIESYLVGLNHEMGRELLWREYPTDMRGSYFRQFWEVKGVSNPDTPADAEKLKDILKVHSWQSVSALGAHKPPPPPDADVQPGEKQVVLVIRGDLLKRYPNTVIYAQKAIVKTPGGVPEIKETDLTDTEFQQHLKFPLFRAEIDPDLRFFGFDLTVDKASGTVPSNDFPGDTEGWFFVIQEVPGDPRFGMDLTFQPNRDNDDNPHNDPPNDWDNLAWDSFGDTEPTFIKISPAPVIPNRNIAEVNAHPWGRNSAQMAYILFQKPVMVAVHASEMLSQANI